MRLEDAQVVLTGAAGGLGRRFALELLAAGAAVAAGDADAAGLRALRREAEGLPGRLHVAVVDVTDEESVARFVAEADGALGGVNSLIHAAGILRDGLLVQRDGEAVRTMTLAQWRKVLDVNLTGAFLVTREVAARMVAAGRGGVVVHLSSLSRHGNPGQANYAASKAGLDAAVRTWALELAPFGIRVGAVAPGVTDTGFLQGIAPERLAAFAAAVPLGRLGKPEEMWAAVRFVFECEFFNGRVLEVDGGAAM